MPLQQPRNRQVTRWRLNWWLAGTPEHFRSAWYSHQCKLCAAKRAYDLGCVMADLARVNRSNVRWSVGRVRGHLTEPQIVATFSSVGLELLKRHGH